MWLHCAVLFFFSFLKRAGKGNRLRDPAKKWHAAWVGTAARTHELPITPRLPFVCLSLSLSLFVCLSVRLPPPTPSGCFCGLFSCRCHSDCDADGPNRLPVCLDMSSVCVCVCLIKRQSALGLERKCLENYVMSSFLKGEKVKKKKKSYLSICTSLCLHTSQYTKRAQCSRMPRSLRHGYFRMSRELSVDISPLLFLNCLFCKLVAVFQRALCQAVEGVGVDARLFAWV